MADVFISYKRTDHDGIVRIADALVREGLSVWYDSSIGAGEIFSDIIDREARAARVILVCWSPEALQSRWVKAEAMLGFESDKLVACYVAGPGFQSAPTPFNAVHAEDLRIWLGAPSPDDPAFSKMLARIRKLCGRDDAPAPEARTAAADQKTLAVLPFECAAADAEAQLLADGFAEEIILSLSKFREFAVISRTSSFQFRNDRKPDAGRLLGATHVLDGAVRKSGRRMRVSAELSEIATARILWSDRFESDAEDVFDIQDEIARGVVTALRFAFATGPRPTRIDPDAFEYYLKGRELTRLQTDASTMEAVALLEGAARVAPDHAHVFASLAWAQASRLIFEPMARQQEIAARVDEHAARAIAINPHVGEAYAARIAVMPDIGRWREKQAILDAGVREDPNDASLLTRRGLFRLATGFVAEALGDYASAFRLDPVSPQTALGEGIAA